MLTIQLMCCICAHKCKMMHKPTTTSLRCPATHRTRCAFDPVVGSKQFLRVRATGRRYMVTRLDHLEMVLERRWSDCSNCRHLPRSDRSALVGGCTETTSGVKIAGQTVKPAWHWAAADINVGPRSRPRKLALWRRLLAARGVAPPKLPLFFSRTLGVVERLI